MPNHRVDPADAGLRLDQVLALRLPEHSRARWQQLIREGRVQVDNQPRKANYLVRSNETIRYEVPPPEPVTLAPEAIPLDILHEDQHLLVINKQPGLVVHPAPGNPNGTLINALLHHCPNLPGIGGEQRPGLVHRLDKDTSGLMVVAKSEQALNLLQTAFKQRTVEKRYHCIVDGRPPKHAGSLITTIGRSSHDRKKMAVNAPNGRRAVTHWQREQAFDNHALLTCRIETGRTHQIRVHMSHLRCPIVGDATYGPRKPAPTPIPVARQMLHASLLAFPHPNDGQIRRFEQPLPPDMAALLSSLAG